MFPRLLQTAAVPCSGSSAFQVLLRRTMASSAPQQQQERGTKYIYKPDGRVEHQHMGGKPASRPLTVEEAGEEPWRTSQGTDDYLVSKLASPKYAGDKHFDKARARADEAGVPCIAVSAMFGQLMTILTKFGKVEKVLEIGTLAGYSTAFFARGLPSHGQIDTIEYSPENAKVAQANFLDLDLYPFPKVHVGAALDLLRDPHGPFANPPGAAEGFPESEQGYDLIFVDANKDQYYEYFQEALRLTRKGGVIVFDDAIRQGRIAGPDGIKADHDAEGLRKIYNWVEQDKGKTVLASALQTVGGTRWDGFAVVYKL